MIRCLLSAILFLHLLPAAHAQTDREELIAWNKNKKLDWADYKAAPDPQSDAAASTTTHLKVEYRFTNNQFAYTIKSSFSQSKSWGLHKTAYILSHEQGHFDIAEIFARKLNKALSNYIFNKRTFQKDLALIYNTIVNEKTKMQNEYDEETNHSINTEKQKEWLTKIEALLNEYEAWSGYQNKP